ncbi:MAG: MBL fold metallo-hydrolase [Candidatus Micrarchaeota archaeon]
MKIFIAFLLAFFVFGCILPGGNPPQNDTTAGNKTVIIVVEPPKNTSVATNETEEPIGENDTDTGPKWTGVNYTYDVHEKAGVYFIAMCDNAANVHGGAILIKKGDFDMVIDAGGAATSSTLIGFLHDKGVDDIDVLVSTADDAGKYGGLGAVTNEFSVEEFWWGGQALTPAYQAVIQAAGAKAQNVTIVKAGYTRELDGMTIEVLNPNNKYYADADNDAVVLRIQDRNTSVLLMSNVLTGEVNYLASNYQSKIKVNVLEAPFYGTGAATKTMGLFLQNSKPDYVVMEGCLDDNPTGISSRNPFRILLELEQNKVPYYETYKNGTVKITIGENDYAVTTE